jgi:hypothetical protein
MRRRAIAAQAAALTTLIALAGCFAAGGDKSGGSSSPHELVLANNDGNLDGVPSVAQFVRRAEALSGGKLTVRVASRWRGGEDEPRVIEDVAAGRADLGVGRHSRVRSRRGRSVSSAACAVPGRHVRC